MDTERIKELFADESFVKQLMEQEEPEQVQALLLERDVDLTIEQIVQIREMIEKQLNGEINLEELSEEELENVSGGLTFLACCIIGVAVTAVATGVGFAVGGAASATHFFTRRRW